MKKILLFLLLLLFVKVDVFATDACDKLILQESSFIWKAVLTSNLRDYPCIYKSSIYWASKIGDKYEIISKVDGWYKIKTNEWSIYWIWDKAIIKTNDVIDTTPKYVLNIDEKILVYKFVAKVDKIVQKKWINYKFSLLLKISDILDKKKYSLKITTILEEIIKWIQKIEVRKEEIVEDKVIEKELEEEVKEINSSENTYNLKNIDINRVKTTWLSWYNDVRKDLWRKAYSYNSKLEKTAIEWSKLANSRNEITHKRNSSDSYYDYSKINTWFKDRGVVCKNIYRVTHSENIGWGTFSCSDSDCTDELINWIKSSFDFYMSEKDKDYKAHYLSITNNYFTQIGLWIDIEESWNSRYKYYLTVHYCTELVE